MRALMWAARVGSETQAASVGMNNLELGELEASSFKPKRYWAWSLKRATASLIVAVERERLEASVLAEALVIRRDGGVGWPLHGCHLPPMYRKADQDVSEGELLAAT